MFNILNIFKKKPTKYLDSKAFLFVKASLANEGYPIDFNKEFLITNVDGKKVTCEVDIYFPHIKIGVEVDGEHHLDLKRIDKDNHKDIQLFHLYGVKIFRLTTNRTRNKEYLLSQIRLIVTSGADFVGLMNSVILNVSNKIKGY